MPRRRHKDLDEKEFKLDLEHSQDLEAADESLSDEVRTKVVTAREKLKKIDLDTERRFRPGKTKF